MSQKYIGGIITKSPVVPSGPYETDAAKGIWTLEQAMQFKKQGIWPTAGNQAPPTVIGQSYGGGFYAGQIGVSGTATHYLVVGPKASAESQKRWKTANTSTSGTSSVIDGPANSTAMNDASHPAAEFCEGLTIGGFSDWYMPAKNELEVCYYNLKPTTSNNNTSSGINANAVPARASNYTTGTPAQTSATIFRNSGSEYYQGDLYWSSTERSTTQGWNQNFDYGRQYGSPKNYTLYWVRAVRRVAV